ncbi:glutamate--tRNA ligase [Candidatus Omnitrophota bacterium]
MIFKVLPEKIKLQDLIHKEIEFDASLIKDQVLIKSDGMPTYNFACVVDDCLMKITHVIRGDDHISNTPKQLILCQALGFPIPQFAHLPLILGKEGGRLSKRTGATSISEFRELGFLSEALVNYLLCLGWSPGDNREIIDIDEAAAGFDIVDANKTAAVFDRDKLNWMNNQYIKQTPVGKLADLLIPLIKEKFPLAEDYYAHREKLEALIRLYQGRINTLGDFLDWADFFFAEEVKVDEKLRVKFFAEDLSKEFSMFIERLDRVEQFTVEGIERAFRDLVKELNIASRKLIHPIRVALTGKTVGPGLFEAIFYLGRDKTKARLARYVKNGG